jgi:4-hydroxy-tetrahydrodipicolinate reductase
MYVQVMIVGVGKLGVELLTSLQDSFAFPVVPWRHVKKHEGPSIVVHTGSGRELMEVVRYCEETDSVLLELSTGSVLQEQRVMCPVVICPNTNVLMLKFMAMLSQSGPQFKNYRIELIESHQADKSSVPGTAVQLAHALGLKNEQVISVRNPTQQRDELGIAEQYLSRHAYHRVVIEDGMSSVSLETKVFGSTPYADGVANIIQAVCDHTLEKRLYNILEFVERGWL